MVEDRGKAISVLTMNTLAFTVCFAVWMMNGVLITHLVNTGAYAFTEGQMGILIGTPVLTGALMRLPAGLLTDRYGGRPVFAILMLLTAGAAFLTSFADSYTGFVLGALGFGLAGASFAVGIAYTSVWFPSRLQGTALGIFGAGNAGAAITSMGAPWLLTVLTDAGTNPEGWRDLPRLYGASLIVMTVVFWLFTTNKKLSSQRSLAHRLSPLRNMRVWRFGLYYFVVFGGFVALAQWLIPYYVNVYTVSVATAGMLAAIFTLPSGVIRAFGGWLSDRFGARTVMYWVLAGCAACSLLLVFPRMEIFAPGNGVLAKNSGTVEAVSSTGIVVDGREYALAVRTPLQHFESENLVFPTSQFWHEAAVEVGDTVGKKELLARGTTRVYFQANMWIFTAIVFVIGILMGIGKAAVYKHIPTYFPDDVGVVGGIVGVLGGLGGFVCPILFGYLLGTTGIWTTCWIFFTAVSLWCLVWMHRVVRRLMAQQVPHLMQRLDMYPAGQDPRDNDEVGGQSVPAA